MCNAPDANQQERHSQGSYTFFIPKLQPDVYVSKSKSSCWPLCYQTMETIMKADNMYGVPNHYHYHMYHNSYMFRQA